MAEFNEIADIDSYNKKMSRPIMDKLFFVDKVNTTIIIDFGSADGCLIEHLMPWYPDAYFIGYDNNPEMNKIARERIKSDRVKFFDHWHEVTSELCILAGKLGKDYHATIVLSSVIHEVYHYSEVREIDQFWRNVFCNYISAVVIRDMIPSRTIERPSDVNDVAKVYRKFLRTAELQDFETNFGGIESNRNLVHFLLKYRYTTPNWAREVKENYFPLYREDLLAMIPFNFDITYSEHYVLPYVRKNVLADFRIDLKDPVHLKLILEKVGHEQPQ